MSKIRTDLDGVLSLEDKKRILREIHQDDLLDLFKKNYTPQYKTPEKRNDSLDHQISITISQKEKDYIMLELQAIKNAGPSTSLSSFIRSRSIGNIDIEDWGDRAVKGLIEFTKPYWNTKELEKEKRKYIKLLDDIDEDNQEDSFFYEKKINELDDKINRIKRKSAVRGFRVAGRVTFDEANLIRWRAARLTLTVADYIRFLIFGYVPFENDDHLSLEARKRFYIAIADVRKNGWGNPPVPDESDLTKLKEENRVLKNKINRYERIIKIHGLSIEF
jgi:hypothetical protein